MVVEAPASASAIAGAGSLMARLTTVMRMVSGAAHALVAEFAENVAQQTDAIWRGESTAGNKHAKRYIAAFEKLRAIGDSGRDALCVLFTHERPDVRTTAAAFLLRYRTAEALAVLREVAAGKGLVPFGASEALKRWDEHKGKESTWGLDPA